MGGSGRGNRPFTQAVFHPVLSIFFPLAFSLVFFGLLLLPQKQSSSSTVIYFLSINPPSQALMNVIERMHLHIYRHFHEGWHTENHRIEDFNFIHRQSVKCNVARFHESILLLIFRAELNQNKDCLSFMLFEKVHWKKNSKFIFMTVYRQFVAYESKDFHWEFCLCLMPEMFVFSSWESDKPFADKEIFWKPSTTFSQ